MKTIEVDAPGGEVVDDRVEDSSVSIDAKQRAEAGRLEIQVEDGHALALLGELERAGNERSRAANSTFERVERHHGRLSGDQRPELLALLGVEPALLGHPTLHQTPAPLGRLHGASMNWIVVCCICPALGFLEERAGYFAAGSIVPCCENGPYKELFKLSYQRSFEPDFQRITDGLGLPRTRCKDEPHTAVRISHRARAHDTTDSIESRVRLAYPEQLREHAVECHHRSASSATRPSAHIAAIISVAASHASRIIGSVWERSNVPVAL